MFIACWAATIVPASPRGGSVKCITGSATLKNSRPMPMPALKSMANQEALLYSGSSSSLPSLICPYGLTNSHSTNTRKNVTARI